MAAEGESEVDLLEGDGVFTGFNMQRFTCLFKLDATPKRRPQVSHTNAASDMKVSQSTLMELAKARDTHPFLRYVRGDAANEKCRRHVVSKG